LQRLRRNKVLIGPSISFALPAVVCIELPLLMRVPSREHHPLGMYPRFRCLLPLENCRSITRQHRDHGWKIAPRSCAI